MLRNFFIWLFSNDKPLEITVFSFWHIFYTLLIIGATIFLGVYVSKKDDAVKEKTLSILASAVLILYIADFFIQPLMHGDAATAGEMNIDKLPFHICTVMCPMLALVQYNKKFALIKEPIALLSIIGPLMYLTFPNGALGDVSPFSYKIIQTFLYHGAVFAWGFMMIATKTVIPSIKNWWKSFIAIIGVALWASLGNAVYSTEEHGYDWFFLTGSAFPFVPKPLMPFAVIFAILGMVFIIYGIYYGYLKICERHKEKICKSAEKEEVTV